MHYADIKQVDVANGPGVRVSLFVSGCTHCCKNCFNPETWDFQYGKVFTEHTIDAIISLVTIFGAETPTKISAPQRAETRENTTKK